MEVGEMIENMSNMFLSASEKLRFRFGSQRAVIFLRSTHPEVGVHFTKGIH